MLIEKEILMKRVVNKLENSKVEVVCDVDELTWKDAQEKAFQKLASELEIKGFRKGKAPESIARKHIDLGKIFNEAINLMLQPAYEEVLREEKLQPFARPSVDVTKVSDTELQLKFVIVLAPEVKLGQYKGLNIEKAKVSVSQKEVQEAIDRLVSTNASLVVTEEAAKEGDTVVMDFVGKVDGKEFDGGKAENYSLELGSHQFIPGFEEQLVGHKSGEVVEVNVKFPEQYVPELAGKDATFTCTLHEVKQKVLPELNEELIKDLNIPEVKDVEGLKAYEKEQIKSQKEQEATNEVLNKIIEKVASEATIELAHEMIDDEVEGMRKNLEQQIQSRGMTLEQYLQITGQKEEDLSKKMHEDAEKNLRAILVMEQIAKEENITVDEKDIDFEMAKIADQYHMELDKVKEILGKDLPRFSAEIRQRRITDFLLKENVAK